MSPLARLADRPWLVFAAFAALYVAGAAQGPAGGDSGEFMVLAAVGGVAHPPGYPLYGALLWLVGLLPVGDVAWRASALSGLLAAGALAVLHDGLRRMGPPGAALAAVAALGLGLNAWRYATVAEVFAGAMLVGALVLRAAIAVRLGARGPRAAAALGLAGAAGIAHHHTVIFLAPVFLWALGVLLAPPGRRAATAGAFGAALLPGFLAYLLLVPDLGGFRWGDTTTLDGLLHHFLRRDYGTFEVTVTGDEAEAPLAHLRMLLAERPPEWGWWFVVPAAVGAATALRPGPGRGLGVAVVLAWVLSGPVFLEMFDTPVDRVAFTQRFYLVSDVLLAPLVAWGLAALGRPALVAGLSAVALVGLAARGAPVAPHATWNPLAEYAEDVLAVLPPDAVVVAGSDNGFAALHVPLVAQGRRPDVLAVVGPLLPAPWYRATVAHERPAAAPLVAGDPDTVALVGRARAEGRPVFLTLDYARRPELHAALGTLVPYAGVLYRVFGPEEPVPPLAAIEAQNRAAALAMPLDHRLAGGPLDRLRFERTREGWALNQRALAWWAIAGAYERAGDEAGRARCAAMALSVVPWTE